MYPITADEGIEGAGGLTEHIDLTAERETSAEYGLDTRSDTQCLLSLD